MTACKHPTTPARQPWRGVHERVQDLAFTGLHERQPDGLTAQDARSWATRCSSWIATVAAVGPGPAGWQARWMIHSRARSEALRSRRGAHPSPPVDRHPGAPVETPRRRVIYINRFV